uniref:Uncharacterized protein n=1 Tax=Rhizophora mucronata TaxID=61149 RepID=A0A2P2NUK3_RHIMU
MNNIEIIGFFLSAWLLAAEMCQFVFYINMYF